MTMIDVDLDAYFAPGLTPYDEALEIVYRLRDLAQLVTQRELEQLAYRLAQTTDRVLRRISEGRGHRLDSFPHDFDASVGSGLTFFDEALDILFRLRDLTEIVTQAELEHLGYRLAQTTNDIVFAAGESGQQQRIRITALRQRSR